METQLIIEGVYDRNIFPILDKYQINFFSFDFRPKSFNYLQIYQAKNFLKDLSFSNGPHAKKIFLDFGAEKKWVIDEIIKDLRTVLPPEIPINIFIQPSDEILATEVKDAFLFYYVLCQDAHSIPKLVSEYLNHPQFRGIKIDKYCYGHLFTQGEYSPDLDYLNRIKKNLKDLFQIIVEIDYDWNFEKNKIEHFLIDFFSFKIDSNVEKDFRQIDFSIFDQHVVMLQNKVKASL